jgi:sodium transport system permease protein
MDTSEISDYESALQKESIDVYVTSSTENSTITYQVYYLSSATNSEYAADIIYQSVLQVKQEMRKERVEEAGLDVDYILEPVAYAETDIASKEQSMGSLLGSILPFMLVISLLMGTMYPAIDTTAGERERGTLETILTLPVTNRQLIVSKFLTVALIGIVSALLNIISMGGIAWYMFKVMNVYGNAGSIRVSSFIPAILVCILAILAFSLLISAITMCVTAFAKSYKEANNYITPLMLVVLFTAYIGFIPNVELTRGMAMVPVANICLLVKNLMLFKFDYTIVALVLISNIAYAAFAILFLSKIYDSESILFGEGKTGVQLFEKRSNMKKGGVPTTGDAWFVCMLVIVLVIYFGGLLELKYGIYGVFGTQMMILFVPLLMALYTKKDIKETYSLRKTGLLSFLGGIFLVLGTLLIGVLLSGVMSALFPDSASAVSDSFEDIMNHGIGVSLLVIAFTPAICEELMFRGYIYAAMRNRYKAVTAILIVAAVFGLYHMSIVKFLTTGLLGGMLCYTVYCTGSIFPAMVMHCLNNAISVLVYYYPEAAGRICPILMKESLTGMDILLVFAAGAVLMTVGILILRRNRRKLEERLCE